MLETQSKVMLMMTALDLPLPYSGSHTPGLNVNYGLLRSLVEEEAAEFAEAMVQLEHARKIAAPAEEMLNRWVDVIDAMCDIIVVVHNTSNAMNLDLEPFFNEVHRSNMQKVGGDKRVDGKALKPEGWEGPKLLPLLLEQLLKR